MNDIQVAWATKKVGRLNNLISMLWPLKDYEWEAVVVISDGIISEAKGNEEVRSLVFDEIEKWEVKRRNEIINNRSM